MEYPDSGISDIPLFMTHPLDLEEYVFE